MNKVEITGKDESPVFSPTGSGHQQAASETAPAAAGLEAAVEDSEKITVAEKSLLQKVIRKGLVENKHDLEVQRKDPNSPLISVKSFDALNLRPELLKGVYAMGFNAPSKIQETALPTLLVDP